MNEDQELLLAAARELKWFLTDDDARRALKDYDLSETVEVYKQICHHLYQVGASI